jgi:beta-lactamase regulating signal transducer with metallopeptidase domain
MDFLNNTVISEFIINLSIQLLVISVIGWTIILLLRKKAAIYRSLISSLIMISLMLLIFISAGFQLTNIRWSEPLLSIDQKQTSSSIFMAAAGESTEKTNAAIIEVSKIKNEYSRSSITMPILLNCFGILWLGGFLFVLIKLCYSLIFLRKFKLAAIADLDDEFMIILRKASKVFKFRYVPEILISKSVASPIAIGITRVSVLIPENLYGNMTEDEFRSILFHEFAHIHHKDHLFSILDKFIIGINWWNPFVYRISNEQNLAREDICDNYAIKGIKSAEAYSNCLVNLAEKICLISNLPATAGMAGRKSGLEERVKSILSKERKMFSTTRKSTKLTISIICALIIVFIGGIGISFAEAKSLSKVEDSNQDVKKKLKKIIFPNVEFKNANISTIIRYLNHHSKRNDPDKVGINVVVYFTANIAKKLPKITMKYSNISMDEILQHLCQKTKLKYKVESGSVLLFYTLNKKESDIIRSNFSKSDLAKHKELILLEIRLYTKPKINSPFSECKLILSPRLITDLGEKGTIRFVDEVILKEIGEKINSGFTMTAMASINGDNIELKGKAFMLNLSAQNKPNIDSYIYGTEKKGLIYKLKIKEREKFYKIGIIENKGIIFEIWIKATLIDSNGKKILIEKNNKNIRKKLKETKIENFNIKGMKVSDAVKMLSKKYGINIFLKLTPQERKKEPIVDLVLKKVNLYQLVWYFCKAADLKFRIRENAIIMSSKLIPPTKEEIQREKERAKELAKYKARNYKKWKLLTEKRLKKIVFPNIEFKNDNIFSIIRVLNRYGKRNDPDKKGIPVIAGFDRKTADGLPKVTMKYSNISMYEILAKLCKNTGLQYTTEEGAVILLSGSIKKVLEGKAKPATLAINAAKNWLVLVDTEKYPESWEEASRLFRKAITKEQWANAVKSARKPLGKNLSRKLKLKRYYTSLPGAPDGKYFVIQFKASFENKKSAIETITSMLDMDGKWRVSGYFIK